MHLKHSLSTSKWLFYTGIKAGWTLASGVASDGLRRQSSKASIKRRHLRRIKKEARI